LNIFCLPQNELCPNDPEEPGSPGFIQSSNEQRSSGLQSFDARFEEKLLVGNMFENVTGNDRIIFLWKLFGVILNQLSFVSEVVSGLQAWLRCKMFFSDFDQNFAAVGGNIELRFLGQSSSTHGSTPITSAPVLAKASAKIPPPQPTSRM
jgi:hypothetical protein